MPIGSQNRVHVLGFGQREFALLTAYRSSLARLLFPYNFGAFQSRHWSGDGLSLSSLLFYSFRGALKEEKKKNQ
jgi:hypothetical protein